MLGGPKGPKGASEITERLVTAGICYRPKAEEGKRRGKKEEESEESDVTMSIRHLSLSLLRLTIVARNTDTHSGPTLQ